MFATDLSSQDHVTLATGEPSIEAEGGIRTPVSATIDPPDRSLCASTPADLADRRSALRLLLGKRDLLVGEPFLRHPGHSSFSGSCPKTRIQIGSVPRVRTPRPCRPLNPRDAPYRHTDAHAVEGHVHAFSNDHLKSYGCLLAGLSSDYAYTGGKLRKRPFEMRSPDSVEAQLKQSYAGQSAESGKDTASNGARWTG